MAWRMTLNAKIVATLVAYVVVILVFILSHRMLAFGLVAIGAVAYIALTMHTIRVFTNEYSPSDWNYMIAMALIIIGGVLVALGKISFSDYLSLIMVALGIISGKYVTASVLRTADRKKY
jgi:peptidoglycan/LPS O-acetylase OafA/YrhL